MISTRSSRPCAMALGTSVAIAAACVALVSGQQRPGPGQGTARPQQAAGPRVIANDKTATVKTQYGDVRGFIHDGIHHDRDLLAVIAQ